MLTRLNPGSTDAVVVGFDKTIAPNAWGIVGGLALLLAARFSAPYTWELVGGGVLVLLVGLICALLSQKRLTVDGEGLIAANRLSGARRIPWAEVSRVQFCRYTHAGTSTLYVYGKDGGAQQIDWISLSTRDQSAFIACLGQFTAVETGGKPPW